MKEIVLGAGWWLDMARPTLIRPYALPMDKCMPVAVATAPEVFAQRARLKGFYAYTVLILLPPEDTYESAEAIKAIRAFREQNRGTPCEFFAARIQVADELVRLTAEHRPDMAITFGTQMMRLALGRMATASELRVEQVHGTPQYSERGYYVWPLLDFSAKRRLSAELRWNGLGQLPGPSPAEQAFRDDLAHLTRFLMVNFGGGPTPPGA